MTGNPAWRRRVAALEASRAAISASTRVRRNSSGLHRWVFAVTSSSGASRRIAAIFSRFSPSVRSAGSTGGAAVTMAHSASPSVRRCRYGVDLVGVQGPGRHRRQGQHLGQRVPGRPRGGGCAGGGEDGADVGGPPPPIGHGPLQRGDQRVAAVRSGEGDDVGELAAELGHPGGGRADQERLRGRAERAEVLLHLGSGPGCPVRLVRAGPVVVGVVDAGLTRPDQAVFGQHLPGQRRDHAQHWSRWW